MLTNEIIRLQAEAQQDYVIESRRTIHRFAEVSGKEFKTSAFIEEEIKKAGEQMLAEGSGAVLYGYGGA